MSNNGINAGIVGQLLSNMRVPAKVSRGELDLMRRMADEEDRDTGEQLTRCVPGGWMLDLDTVAGLTAFRLIRHCFISQDGEESGGTSYWRLNETGRQALALHSQGADPRHPERAS